MRIGSENPINEKDVMKSVVMLVEKKINIIKQAKEIHEKLEFFENTKQVEEMNKQSDVLSDLQEKFFFHARTEGMAIDMAASKNRNFILN